MGILANLKLRRKLLLAMIPLALMVIIAGTYASIEIRSIDNWYTQLVDHEMHSVHQIDIARALNMHYAFYLYRLIVETDPDRMRSLDHDLTASYSDYKAAIAEAIRLTPAHARQISESAALFDKAVLDSQPVRAAALRNESSRAADLMRAGVDDELQQSRQRSIDLADQMQASVQVQSDELTAKSHVVVRRTWLVIIFGILLSIAFASYLLHVDVV